MNRSWHGPVVLGLLAALFWPRDPHPVLSEIPPDDRSMRLSDTTITRLDPDGSRRVLQSEQMTRFEDGRIATGPFTLSEEAEGKVHSLSAQHGTAEGDVVRAQGKVVLKSGGVVADAEQAEYRRDAERIQLAGNVEIHFDHPPLVMRGPSAEYDLAAGTLVMADGVKGVMP